MNNKPIIQKLRLVITGVDKTGALKTWAHFALNGRYWRHLISGLDNYLTPTPPSTPPPPSAKFTHPPPPVNLHHRHQPHQKSWMGITRSPLPCNQVKYPYPFLGVIFMVILHDFI